MKFLLVAVVFATVSFGEVITFDSTTSITNNTSSPAETTVAATPDPAWATALPGSEWITTTGNIAPPIGTNVVFTENLDISGPFDAAILNLGVFAADSATVMLDGTTLFTENTNLGMYCSSGVIGCVDGTEGVLSALDVTSDLHLGTNTLTFQVFRESNSTAFGLDFAGSLVTSNVVTTPEPSCAVVLGCGLLGVVLTRRRSRNAA